MKTEEKKSGFSRRDLITKGAVAGAIVWAVPMIETVPAYAAVGSIAAMSCSYGFIIYSDTSSPTSTSNYYLACFPSGSSTCSTTGANNQLSSSSSLDTLQSATLTFTTWNSSDLGTKVIVTVTDSFGTHEITSIDCRGVGTMTSPGNTVGANANYYFLAAFAWNYNSGTNAHVGQVGTTQAPGSSITSSSVTFGTSC